MAKIPAMGRGWGERDVWGWGGEKGEGGVGQVWELYSVSFSPEFFLPPNIYIYFCVSSVSPLKCHVYKGRSLCVLFTDMSPATLKVPGA